MPASPRLRERSPLNIAPPVPWRRTKIKYTIEAARAVIENLPGRDTVSLVTFNDKVTVLSPAGRVVNKAFLFHRLEEVVPESPYC